MELFNVQRSVVCQGQRVDSHATTFHVLRQKLIRLQSSVVFSGRKSQQSALVVAEKPQCCILTNQTKRVTFGK